MDYFFTCLYTLPIIILAPRVKYALSSRKFAFEYESDCVCKVKLTKTKMIVSRLACYALEWLLGNCLLRRPCYKLYNLTECSRMSATFPHITAFYSILFSSSISLQTNFRVMHKFITFFPLEIQHIKIMLQFFFFFFQILMQYNIISHRIFIRMFVLYHYHYYYEIAEKSKKHFHTILD